MNIGNLVRKNGGLYLVDGFGNLGNPILEPCPRYILAGWNHGDIDAAIEAYNRHHDQQLIKHSTSQFTEEERIAKKAKRLDAMIKNEIAAIERSLRFGCMDKERENHKKTHESLAGMMNELGIKNEGYEALYAAHVL